MITRINVPLFFMISGALLLEKEEDANIVFKKRFLRIILVLLFFDVLFVVIQWIKSIYLGISFKLTIVDFISGFLNNQIKDAGAYWYLYSYLGFLFILPMLQRMVKGFTKIEFFSILLLHFIITSILPMISIVLLKKGMDPIQLSGYFNVPYAMAKPFFYPLVGYYLEYNIDVTRIKMPHIFFLVLIAFVGIVLSNTCTYIDASINGQYSQNYVQLFDYLTAIVFFLLIKYLYSKKVQPKGIVSIDTIICFLGSMTLGIYMIDPILNCE